MQVAVPPIYVARLKVIHAAATKHIYGKEAAISSETTADGMYGAQITFTDHPHKYNAIPMKSAAAAEADAIFQSLRYMTNIGAYKILDLNHYLLAQLTSSINRENADLILLQTCVNAMITHTESTYEDFLHQLDESMMPATDAENVQHIQQLIDQVISFVDKHHTSMVESFHGFMDFKVNPLPILVIVSLFSYTHFIIYFKMQTKYLTTHLETESPITRPSRWIWAQPTFNTSPATAQTDAPSTSSSH